MKWTITITNKICISRAKMYYTESFIVNRGWYEEIIYLFITWWVHVQKLNIKLHIFWYMIPDFNSTNKDHTSPIFSNSEIKYSRYKSKV